MLRTAAKPRWLALLVLVLLAATGMARLGQWQWDRARENNRRHTVQARASRPAVPLTSLLAPRQSFTNADADRPVTATGTWDPAHQVLVADRYLSGRKGWWVLTPLRLPDGSAVAVVRGWTPSTTDPAASPRAAGTGRVDIAGVLRPSEPPIDREPGTGPGLPPGQLDGVDLTELVRLWPYRLITGYVVLTGQAPAPAAGSAVLAPVPPTTPGSRDLAWQNVSYAVQWFVFAGFGLFMWWRLVRDDHLGRLPGPPAGRVPVPGPPPGRPGSTAAATAPTPGTAATAGESTAGESTAGQSTASESSIDRGAHP